MKTLKEAPKDAPRVIQGHWNELEDLAFATRVTGSTFYDNAQKALMLVKRNRVPSSNMVVTLKREPDNPADPNAVEVYLSITGAKRSYKVGYVPRECAEFLSYALLHDELFQVNILHAKVCGGEGDKPLCGLYFDFDITKRGD